MAPIEISDFGEQGVSLMPATDPNFEARAGAILGSHAAEVMELAPYLTILTNRNPRTVVAYTVMWSALVRNGSTEFNYTQMKFPDAVAGTANGLALLQGREMKTGDERLVGMGFEVWPPQYARAYCEFGLQTAAALGSVVSLAMELDGVIFEDGTMLGPDRSRLAENFIQAVQVKQAMYREIVIGLENGDSLDAVFAPLRELLTPRQRAAHADGQAGYRQQAAAEILGFHGRVALEVFRRTLRREPFAIKRLSGMSD